MPYLKLQAQRLYYSMLLLSLSPLNSAATIKIQFINFDGDFKGTKQATLYPI